MEEGKLFGHDAIKLKSISELGDHLETLASITREKQWFVGEEYEPNQFGIIQIVGNLHNPEKVKIDLSDSDYEGALVVPKKDYQNGWKPFSSRSQYGWIYGGVEMGNYHFQWARFRSSELVGKPEVDPILRIVEGISLENTIQIKTIELQGKNWIINQNELKALLQHCGLYSHAEPKYDCIEVPREFYVVDNLRRHLK